MNTYWKIIHFGGHVSVTEDAKVVEWYQKFMIVDVYCIPEEEYLMYKMAGTRELVFWDEGDSDD